VSAAVTRRAREIVRLVLTHRPVILPGGLESPFTACHGRFAGRGGCE